MTRGARAVLALFLAVSPLGCHANGTSQKNPKGEDAGRATGVGAWIGCSMREQAS